MKHLKLLVPLIVALLVPSNLADEHDHRVSPKHDWKSNVEANHKVWLQYEDGEEVVLWMNTVGPYHNRQETYNYFSLPFCQGPKQSISHYHETLGENLQGIELEVSGLQIDFKGVSFHSEFDTVWQLDFAANIAKSPYCMVVLTEEKLKAFMYAVKNHYWYQMYLDDLPIWGKMTLKSLWWV